MHLIRVNLLVLFAALLVVDCVHSQPLQQFPAPKRTFSPFDNYVLDGTEWRRFPAESLQACISACSDAICVAFNYNKWNSSCSLLRDFSAARLDPSSSTGLLSDRTFPALATTPLQWKSLPNKLIVGTLIESTTASAQSCEQLCQSNSECIGFTQVSSSNACKLFATADKLEDNQSAKSQTKSQQAVDVAPVITQSPVAPASKPQTPEDAMSDYAVRVNRDIYGADIVLTDGRVWESADDIAKCAIRCNSIKACIAFSYDRWKTKCYFKDRIISSVLDPRSTIAVKRPADIPNVSEELPIIQVLRNRSLIGKQFSESRTPSFDACKQVCGGQLKCIGFNFEKTISKGTNCKWFNFVEGYAESDLVDSGYKYQSP